MKTSLINNYLQETKMCCVAVSKGNVKEDDVIIVNGK